MFKKSPGYKIVIALSVIAASVTTSGSIALAKVPDAFIEYQVGGHTCWSPNNPTMMVDAYGERSPVVSTPTIESLSWASDGWGAWAANRDKSDVNCLKINLYPSQSATTVKNFKLCGQAADANWQNAGAEVCTDEITNAQGAFAKMTTATGGAIGSVRFRFSAPSFGVGSGDQTVRVMRISTQLENVNGTVGNKVSTAWSDVGFVNANVNHAGGALKTINLMLETKGSPGTSCTEAIPCTGNKVLSLANTAGLPGEGTQYASVSKNSAATNSIFTIGNNLTYEAYIYKKGNNAYAGIISVGDSDPQHNGYPALFASANGTGLGFRLGVSSKAGQCTGGCQDYYLNQNIPLGVWTHVAVTVANGNTLTWFIDGYQVKQDQIASWNVSASPTQTKAHIGNDVPGVSEYLNGYIDEVQIWNVARTASQVADDKSHKLSGNESGLVDYWNFDDNAGADLTGNTGDSSHTVALKNGATIVADPATDPLKLCTQNTCNTTPPPEESSSTPPEATGDIRVDRVTGTALTPVTGSTAYLNANTTGVTDNPAMFLKLVVDSHTVKVTNAAGTKEVGTCSFARGGTPCTPSSFASLPASACDSQKCSFVVPTTADKVTRLIFRYTPPAAPATPPASCSDGIDNDNDGKIDNMDTGDCTVTSDPTNIQTYGGGSPTGEVSTPPTEAACSVFSASPLTLIRDIGHSTITWACTGGTGFPVLTDNNPNFNDLGSLGTLNGNRNVSPRESTTFTLTYGSVVKTLKITVNDSNFGEIIP